MDGINGITALYSLSVLVTCYYLNMLICFSETTLIEYAGMGLIIFSFFNLRKTAKCFAGDVGSVGMAFILAYLVSSLILTSANWQYILVVSIYGVDSVVTIIERLIRRENIFNAHRSHLYQYLANEVNWSHISISLIYSFLQILFNILLIVFIIPSKNNLLAITYIGTQVVLYLFVKRKIMRVKI